MRMQHRASLVLLFMAICFTLTGCMFERSVPAVDSRPVESASLRKQVMLLASKAGIPGNKIERSSTKELLLDIEFILNECHGYQGHILTDAEMSVLSNYLNDQPKILRTIKSYNNYMQIMRDKKIIAITENADEW